jgi:hypothetical protein
MPVSNKIKVFQDKETTALFFARMRDVNFNARSISKDLQAQANTGEQRGQESIRVPLYIVWPVLDVLQFVESWDVDEIEQAFTAAMAAERSGEDE